MGLIPGGRTKILCALWLGQKNKIIHFKWLLSHIKMLSFHLFLAITFSFFLYIYIAFKAPPFVSLFFLLLTFFPFSQLLLPQVTSLLFSSVMPLPFDFFHQLLFPFLPGSFSFCFASFLSAYLYFPFLCLSPPPLIIYPTVESNKKSIMR